MADGEVIFQKGEDEDENNIWDDTALIKAYDSAIKVMKSQFTPAAAAAQEDGLEKDGHKKGKKKRSRRKHTPKDGQNVGAKTEQWKVGDHCQAIYTGDAEIYEAVIKSLKPSTRTCTVRYLGYGNEEEHLIDDLLPSNVRKTAVSQTPSMASDVQSSVCSDREERESESGMEWQQQQQQQHRGLFSPRGRGSGGAPWSFPGPMPPPPPPMPPSGMPMPPPSMFPPPHPASWSGHHPASAAPMHFPSIPPPPMPDLDSDLGEDKDALYSMLMSWYMSGYHTGYYQGLKEGRKSGQKNSSHYGGKT